jgi:hypothetical protein
MHQSAPGRRRDRQPADPRKEITGLGRRLRDRRRRGLLGGRAATRLFLTVIAGVILLPACHPLTERPGHLAHR